MDARRKYQSNQNIYVYGNTARNLAVRPERENWEENGPLVHRPQRRNPKTRTESVRGIDLGAMLVLLLAMGITLYVCIKYLEINADILQVDKKITVLEETLSQLIDDNDTIEIGLAEALDMEQIYQTAVGELGMVFPNHSKVITYQQRDCGFVRQQGTIPEIDKLSIIERLFP